MPNFFDFAMKMIEKNPNIANNPRNQQMIEVLKSGDQAKGEELANNLCESYGVSKEEAMQQAQGFFNGNFPMSFH